MAQEPSILPDLSTRATQEYSDLFAVSGSSFLCPIDQTSSLSSIRTDSPPSSSSNSNSSLLMDSRVLNSVTNQPANDTSSLIDLISKTPVHPKQIYTIPIHNGDQSPTPRYSDLMDHSISSYNILPKALSPSTPSSRKNTDFLFNPPISPHLHWTPPSSPTKYNKILSPALTRNPSSPSTQNRPKTAPSLGTNITRTHSVDLLGLLDHHSPRPPISRSKSTTAIQPREKLEPLFLSDDTQHDQQQPKFATKSILKRPNSPSKGARARFFSPRVLSGEHTEESDENDSSWVDEHGNCRGREIIHEFQKDEPPMTRLKPTLSSASPMPSPTSPSPVGLPTSSSSSTRRHHHTPKFTIPEPIDLGIEPILPRHSTSPSPSPPSLPAASYLMKVRTHRKSASTNNIQSYRDSRSVSSSLIFHHSPDNFSNILDESGGFLVGNDTTWSGGAAGDQNNKERSTELSIDLNHVAMMELLGKRNLGTKHRSSSTSSHSRTGFPNFNLTRAPECEMVPEEEESVNVSGLARQMEDIKGCSSDNMDLKDEQAPINLRGSMDFSTTFESSKINLPRLPTDREELWKNSQPKKVSPPTSMSGVLSSFPPRAKRNSMSNLDPSIQEKRSKENEDTTRLTKKMDSIRLSTQEKTVIKNDLFSELMTAPPSSSSRRLTTRTTAPLTSKQPPPSSTRPSTTGKRLSIPNGLSFPVQSKPTSESKPNSISKPRTSCISSSVVPVRAKRNSNLGIGLPTTSSAPNINSVATRLSKPGSTTGLTGIRTKLKPSNPLLLKSNATSNGSSPKTMKNRSSLSTVALNSPRSTYQGTTTSVSKKHSLLAPPPSLLAPPSSSSSPTKIRKSLGVPLSSNHSLQVPRSYTGASATSARSSLLLDPSTTTTTRSSIQAPGSLTHRSRTNPFSSAPISAPRPNSESSSKIFTPTSPSKTLATTSRQINQNI
ncbi:hypothetical protein KEM48_003489 [Puccinia striiformis f. sp. tritici PST-130]|nr:hypothetical protein Pst134EB_012078 [Puccinia striiformis f. sp. tritici]KAI9607702.1 hypothetical protein KEM48_003489 [Puccinia striiformis f. sp. tritici PST-130]